MAAHRVYDLLNGSCFFFVLREYPIELQRRIRLGIGDYKSKVRNDREGRSQDVGWLTHFITHDGKVDSYVGMLRLKVVLAGLNRFRHPLHILDSL